MKILYLLRHAKAAPETEGGDAVRPLMKRGRKAAAAMGAFLAGLEPAPELVLCSPSLRTRETLDSVLPAVHPAPRVGYDDALYLASAEELLDRLRHVAKATRCVLVIGHNPGLHELGARLAEEPGRFAQGFPTAALARFEIASDWAALRWHHARLTLYRTPKDVSRDLDGD